ncbi:MAG: carboxy terminal-processing peptidase [Chthoniobacterales bacterium]
MNKFWFSRTLVLAGAVGGLLSTSLSSARSEADLDKVAISVARLLEQGHYSRQKLDNTVSQALLDQYLKDLDPGKLFFIQSDIDEFQSQYATRLDDEILSGDLDPAREIFARYKQRVTDRVASNKPLIAKEYDFSSSETIALDRKEAAWPKDLAEADALWAKRVEAEFLQETLAEHTDRIPSEIIAKRQDQLLRNVEDMDDESVVSDFLAALARTYDPHSEYMSPSELENFEIQMSLSLEGVGAVLQSEDGYAKVKEIVPGGPADLEGHLAVNDRISAVAQGDDPFEDVVDMKLDKVVEKIRGKRGTIVRLQVIPAQATDAAKRKIVTITRDQVSLKEQEAKAEIIDMERPDGRSVRVGWIELPSFYFDPEGRGGENARSTTKDVLSLLTRLTNEGIESLVIDLRQDGGGSLEEAINLTGLFIPQGPVVQSKDSNGQVTVSSDDDTSVAYDGPMIVLMNRLSASASEIFAAALQDYNRAVIVGDEKSFGKGTVQTMLDIGRFMPFFSLGASDAGALKLTINKFYRVRGGSTQLEGVKSDIVLPSITDNPEIGESALPNPLPYDEVTPLPIRDYNAVSSIIPTLRDRSTERIAADDEFNYLRDDLDRLQAKIDSNVISLNIDERKKEIDDDNARKEQRKTERVERGPAFPAIAYEVTLDNASDEGLTAVDFDRKKDRSMFASDEDEDEAEVAPDAIRNETLRIASDMVDLETRRKTAAIASEKTPKLQLQD